MLNPCMLVVELTSDNRVALVALKYLKRLKKLETNNPHIRFIGICIQPFNSMVDQVQKIMKINLKNQFALIDFEKASHYSSVKHDLYHLAIIKKVSSNIKDGRSIVRQ